MERSSFYFSRKRNQKPDKDLAAAEASLAAEKDDEALRHISRAIDELKALRKTG